MAASAIGSAEAFALAGALDRATVHELRLIGRGMAAEDKAAKERAARKRSRELRARLGLTGMDTRRPVRIPNGIPAGEREMFRQLMNLDGEASLAARLRR